MSHQELLCDRGPAGLTSFLRAAGDDVTRLDRLEPDLNTAIPGDPRDTTTPRAMAETLRALFFGSLLAAPSRERLLNWHLRTETGKARLRAGIPAEWPLAHKTGTGDHGATNDVGVIFPPGRGPVLVAAYYAETPAPLATREAVLATVGSIVCRSL